MPELPSNVSTMSVPKFRHDLQALYNKQMLEKQGQTIHRSEAISKGDRQTDKETGRKTGTQRGGEIERGKMKMSSLLYKELTIKINITGLSRFVGYKTKF